MNFLHYWDSILDALEVPHTYPVINLIGQGNVPIAPIRQTRSSTCGAIAARMALTAFGKRINDTELLLKLKFDRNWGVSTSAMISIFRSYQLKVGRIKNPTFVQLANALDKDSLVVTTVKRSGYEHWILIFKVDRDEKKVFIAGDSHFSTNAEIWATFKSRLGTDKELIVISKK